MEIKKMLVPNGKIHSIHKSGGISTMKPRYIVIHETDNTGRGSGAYNHALLQYRGNPRKANWHYSVDSKEIYQSILDTTCVPHAGSFTGNSQGIGIELCVNVDGDFSVTVKKGAELTAYLMKKNNIPLSRVVQHNFFTGKNCPRNIRGRGLWNSFLKEVNNFYKGTVSPKPEAPHQPMQGSIKVGSFVAVKQSATSYANSNKTIPSWVKNNSYKVKKIDGDKALLSDINSWVMLKDLGLVEEVKPTYIGVVEILVPSLNVREKPDFNSKVVKTLKKGSKYKVYRKENGLWNVGGNQWVSAGTSFTRFTPNTNI